MYGWTENPKTKDRREALRRQIVELMLQLDRLGGEIRQLERDAREGRA